ncbi:MAG TPA: phosphatase domain-containing protein [Gemmatimonadaceae bacterium]|nr:phosphatase domain-containing protein [Gemmatimonadaceae bacterium]
MSGDWQRDLWSIAGAVSARARQAVHTVERALGRDPAMPHGIIGYRGYVAGGRALVLGRVLRDTRIGRADPGSSRWDNLLAMLRRLESDPLPHARVRVSALGASREVVTDDEGYLREWIDGDAAAAPPGWHPVALELLSSSDAVAPPAPVRGTAHVLVPPADAELGVVSDIDDTVLQSRITSFLHAIRLMLLENARTRLPFPGVAAFYRALAGGARGGAANPIFYVSSSPWNLYDLVVEFLEAQQIPDGPLLLRDWDIGRDLLHNHAHKLALIRDILAGYPRLPFILVGDSGQEDPEIYSTVVREHPGRILAVYIRNVTLQPERSAAIHKLAAEVRAAGSTLVLADDTLAAARHAALHGWIPEATLREVAADARADEGRAGGKTPVSDANGMERPTPGAGDPDVATRAPTVVLDDQMRARDVGDE